MADYPLKYPGCVTQYYIDEVKHTFSTIHTSATHDTYQIWREKMQVKYYNCH